MEKESLIPFTCSSRNNLTPYEMGGTSSECSDFTFSDFSDFLVSDDSNNGRPLSAKHLVNILNTKKANQAHVIQKTQKPSLIITEIGEKSHHTSNIVVNEPDNHGGLRSGPGDLKTLTSPKKSLGPVEGFKKGEQVLPPSVSNKAVDKLTAIEFQRSTTIQSKPTVMCTEIDKSSHRTAQVAAKNLSSDDTKTSLKKRVVRNICGTSGHPKIQEPSPQSTVITNNFRRSLNAEEPNEVKERKRMRQKELNLCDVGNNTNPSNKPGVVKKLSLPNTSTAGNVGRTAATAGCPKRRSPTLPPSSIVNDKSKVNTPQKSTAIRPKPLVMGTDGGDKSSISNAHVKMPSSRAPCTVSGDLSTSMLPKKPLLRHNDDSIVCGRKTYVSPSPLSMVNSKKMSSTAVVASPSYYGMLDAVNAWVEDSMKAMAGGVARNFHVPCSGSDDLETSPSPLTGQNKSRVNFDESARRMEKPTSSVIDVLSSKKRKAQKISARRKKSAAKNDISQSRIGRSVPKKKLCSPVSPGDFCDARAGISLEVRPPLYSDRKNKIRLIKYAYAEPKTPRKIPTRPGLLKASSYINRMAKERETLRINNILKNKLLKACKPTLRRIR